MDALPKITHRGEVDIRDSKVQVAVLSTGERILLKSSKGLVSNIPFFFDKLSKSDSINVNKKDIERYKIEYQGSDGEKAVAYNVAVIVDLAESCLVYADELRKKELKIPNENKEIVEFSRSLMVCLACIGMTALIDESTSFQEVRSPKDLSDIMTYRH